MSKMRTKDGLTAKKAVRLKPCGNDAFTKVFAGQSSVLELPNS